MQHLLTLRASGLSLLALLALAGTSPARAGSFIGPLGTVITLRSPRHARRRLLRRRRNQHLQPAALSFTFTLLH
jgi:hypothetical protein